MSTNKFELFLEQAKFQSNIIKNAKLENLVVDAKANVWTFQIILADIEAPEVLMAFIQTVKSYFFRPNIMEKIDVKIKYENTLELEKHGVRYIEQAIIELANEKARYLVLKNFKITSEDNNYFFLIDADSMYIKDYIKDILAVLKLYGIELSLKTKVTEDMPKTSKLLAKSIKEQEEVLFQKQIIKKEVVRKTFTKKLNPQTVKISEIPIDLYRLDKYKNEKGDTNFIVEGKVLKLEVRKLTNTSLLSFVLADEEDAIYVKRFLRYDKDFELANSIQENENIQVEGRAEYDTYQKDVVLFANSINFISNGEKEERVDKAKEKRIEFHVHTKMSNMDGVTDVEEYIDQALKFGHEAIAFTDHNGLYAYPDIHSYTKGKPIKAIYGVELDFVDEEKFLIASKTDNDFLLKDATYIVFDIETTGLSPTRDKIIEIGAIKLEQGQVIDSFHSFVDPEEPLLDFTKNLTGITNEMLVGAPKNEEALPLFLKFIEGSTLVAHNALFDVGHIKENAKKLNLEFKNTAVIDTLNIARYYYKDKLKRFNLKALARYFKVKQEDHHRALDDANVTAQIWLSMLVDLQGLNIKNYYDLNNSLESEHIYKHARPYHVNVLVRNNIGYKNLFKIISNALTDSFYEGPRTRKNVFEQFREGLLIGSGCVNGDVFEAALYESDENLKENISYYDYIEVQPIEAYSHLIEDLGPNGKVILEATVSKIIRYAKEQNKIVIASGDVHYLHKSDRVYREMYIRIPLVGGGIHPLAKHEKMPEQYFLTTDEMLQRFQFLGSDLAEEIVIKNTHRLNKLIDKIQAFPSELYSLSDDAFKDNLNIDSIADEVKRLVYEKVMYVYGNEPHPIVTERVNRELTNIIENNFAPNYFMSYLLVKKSLEDGYLVGSRGSVGSSFVATMLDITEVNPLKPHYRCPNGDFTVFWLSEDEINKYGLTKEQRDFQKKFLNVKDGFDLSDANCPICGKKLEKDGHDIPFETFLGFKGDKVPDIDLNFSGEYQAKAHSYIRELLGEDYTFRAGTIQKVAERNAYGFVKGYLEDKNLEVRSAQIERLAKNIEGVKRSTGQHPGGIVIVPKGKTIFDVTPIQYPADDPASEWKTTHFDYHSFEENLIKLDILGHDDPTMIKFLMDYVYENPNEFPFNKATEIPLDDEKVYELFRGTDVIGVKPNEILSDVASYGVPEFGTPFTRQMLVDTKPNTFSGLVKISGLSHGTDVWLKNARSLINGETDFGKIPFDEIIGCRDDIMVQLIEFGMQPLKAFEIMEFVRRGRPGKDKVTWLNYEQEMKRHNVPLWYIWSASQIKYMFPKAHAAAYVIMAIRIAWFKVYKPLLFYSAFFSKRAVQFDYETMMSGSNAIRNLLISIQENFNRKIKEENLLVTLGVALEMTKRGFKFLPIDINLSEATSFVMEADGLRMPFNAVDGLGEAVAYDIVENRKIREFTSRDDVRERTKINKTVFEKLESYGAFSKLSVENNVIENGLFAL